MKKILFRLYKNRFDCNWQIILAGEDGKYSMIYLSPDLSYWTKCLKVVEMKENEAKKYFGHYLDRGQFIISNDYKRLIFGK
jgi:hypothetical protein